jgi:hypothetical protein
LALAYANRIPLGEAPDEPAHLTYARFIATQGQLPTSLAQRAEAGYRSAWPPLYQVLIAGPLALIGDAPPTRLKAVGDSPRRLIATDGHTIASIIHTTDEAPPWRGLPLAWHLARLISVALTTLSVALTYAISYHLTRQASLAAGAAALHAFIPQLLFIGAVLNDDNLLICLSGFILLTLITYPPHPQPHRAFMLGLQLGLATVAKYNALPLWVLVALWGLHRIWQNRQHHSNLQSSSLPAFQPSSQRPPASAKPPLREGAQSVGKLPAFQPFSLLSSILPFLLGVMLSGGWWFSFIWYHFNQIDQLGLVSGSFAALNAGASDASLRQLAAGQPSAIPPVSAWLEWFTTLFETFWGSFGGGSTIDLPGWIYALLALMCMPALIGGVTSSIAAKLSFTTQVGVQTEFGHQSSLNRSKPTFLFFITPLLFLPLPMLRFILTGSLVETAQGRHLFPAIAFISLALVCGVASITHHASRSLNVASGLKYYALPALFTFGLSLYSLWLIQTSYPPPIPLRTTADAVQVEHRLEAKLTDSLTLHGYELGDPADQILPVTLVWQATTSPDQDYLLELTATTPTGSTVASWLGHPLGGRYPTRAWDKGDFFRHTIPLPVLATSPSDAVTLTLRILDSAYQPVTPTPLTLTVNLPSLPLDSPAKPPLFPAQLRTDELAPAAPFTYRSTLSFVLPPDKPATLQAPTGQQFEPVLFIPTNQGSLAHFIVEANWPSGDYQLTGYPQPITISNRPRQFNPPPLSHPLEANFANALTLLGYDLPQRRVQPGQGFPLTLHWRAEQSLGQHLIVFNHLLDQHNTQHGGADRIPQLFYSTLLWASGEIVSDSYLVPVNVTAPPGIYWLDIGLYPASQPTFSLPLYANNQPTGANSLRLGPIKVGGPPPGVTISSAQPQQTLNISFGDRITLLGFTLIEDAQQPQLILYWQADRPIPSDYTVFVHVFDAGGQLVAQFDSPPAAGAYPTSLWEMGEIIVDERGLNNLSPGRYTLKVGLYDPLPDKRLPVTGLADGAITLTELTVTQ